MKKKLIKERLEKIYYNAIQEQVKADISQNDEAYYAIERINMDLLNLLVTLSK